MAFGAVLDACVLIPMATCDVLLRAAQRNLYRPHWSAMILDEVGRNLPNLGIAPEKAASRVAVMRSQFTRAEVSNFEGYIPLMPNHPKDRHVLAAAVVAGAELVVTTNLKHFQTANTPQQHIRAEHPDNFLEHLYGLYPHQMVEIIETQSAALRKNGMQWSPNNILERLERQGCKKFAALLRPHFP